MQNYTRKISLVDDDVIDGQPIAMAGVGVVVKCSKKRNQGRGGRAHSRQHTMRATASPAPITTRALNT